MPEGRVTWPTWLANSPHIVPAAVLGRLRATDRRIIFTAATNEDRTMARTIRLQSDSNAHDRPWRVAVEQGFFKEEGLDVEYYEDNPKGAEGRVKDFAHRWKET